MISVEAARGVSFARARTIVKNLDDADDVAQETVLRSLQWNKRTCRWVYQVASNLALDILRTRKRPLLARPPVDPVEALEVEETREAVRRAVKRLPPRERETIERYYFQGQSTKTIAAEMAAPRGTVCRRLQLARGRLRRMLKNGDL